MQFSTLHEAIASALSIKQPLSFQEIADTIKTEDSWRRPSDGKFPEAKQIRDRSLYKYSELFQRLDNGKLLLNEQPIYSLKISRLAYNDRGWVSPSGWGRKSHTKGLHEADYGFGHEEWLFDFSKKVNGYSYGFIEGLRTKNNKHGGSAYNLQLFTLDGIEKIKYWAAKIDNCYVLTEEEQIDAQKAFISKGWHEEQKKQLMDLGLWNNGAKKSLKSFGPNVRFLEQDVTIFDPPVPVENSVYMSNRYRYLLYDWDDIATINFEDDYEFMFKPSKPNSNKKVWRKNNPEFQSLEIKQLHRQIADCLYKDLVKQYGENNVGCDVANISGTFIDMVRQEKKEFILYEIKTFNQLRKNIREALGQLLEYAYWRKNKKIKEIIIVSEKPLDKPADEYLRFLKKSFNLPISYLRQPI